MAARNGGGISASKRNISSFKLAMAAKHALARQPHIGVISVMAKENVKEMAGRRRWRDEIIIRKAKP